METVPKDPYASQKRYYQKNRDTIKAYYLAKYHENKEEIIPIRRQKFDCELCGGKYTYDHRSQHFNSIKHKSALSKATEEISSLALSIIDVHSHDKKAMEKQIDTLTRLANVVKKTTPRNPKYIDFSSAFSEEA